MSLLPSALTFTGMKVHFQDMPAYRHEGAFPGHAGAGQIVVCRRGADPGGMGAMSRCSLVGEVIRNAHAHSGEIPAVEIVDETVSVIIFAVDIGHSVSVKILTGVEPAIVDQVRVVPVHADIHDADDQRAVSFADRPRVRSLNGVEIPLQPICVIGVVGCITDPMAIARLGIQQVFICGEVLSHTFSAVFGIELELVDEAQLRALVRKKLVDAMDPVPFHPQVQGGDVHGDNPVVFLRHNSAHLWGELDDDLPWLMPPIVGHRQGREDQQQGGGRSQDHADDP
jgi:hypothetical protein